MTDNNKFKPETAIFTPSQTSTNSLNQVKSTQKLMQEGEGLRIPISDEFMRYSPDIMPGQILSVIAQTSNYKTGFMQWVARKNAERWVDEGIDDRIIIYISLEETIEEQGIMELARLSGDPVGELARGRVIDMGRLELAAVQAGTLPIYRIGFSLSNAESYQELHFSNLYTVIRHLVLHGLDWRPKVGGVFIDYLQALPLDQNIQSGAPYDKQRRLQVRQDLFRIRQLSGVLPAPIVIGVQAKQNMRCGTSPIQLPGVYDGEETSAIGQRSDRVYSLWLPKTYHPINQFVSRGNFSFTVKENALWLKVAKQKGSLPAGKTFFNEVDYDNNEIFPETEFRPAVDTMPDWVID